ncbi:MAG: hypothetical protein PHT84_03490, partial [Candidatus Pacebacteria bacterium]|nr:hypothetical protein [Candidatus Paceibacterota bacterium]
MKRRIEENAPNFEINGSNGGLIFKIKPERFFVISSIPRRVVVLGKVISGDIRIGNVIEISLPGVGEIVDHIAEIQINKREIPRAMVNEEIGIRLSRTNIHQLRSLNNGSFNLKKVE